jgi:hypothetical protein
MTPAASHADTIRRRLMSQGAIGQAPGQSATGQALDALDALLAENQQLREALVELQLVAENVDVPLTRERVLRILAAVGEK